MGAALTFLRPTADHHKGQRMGAALTFLEAYGRSANGGSFDISGGLRQVWRGVLLIATINSERYCQTLCKRLPKLLTDHHKGQRMGAALTFLEAYGRGLPKLLTDHHKGQRMGGSFDISGGLRQTTIKGQRMGAALTFLRPTAVIVPVILSTVSPDHSPGCSPSCQIVQSSAWGSQAAANDRRTN
ncbi:hypothetical protein TNCV_3797001 [Trichonephila clavipes]|nr:hypothetical protein TNCV_3797001 [Trichonephila clavipes]